MAGHRLVLLAALVLVGAVTESMAKGKFEKNKNVPLIPKRPAGPPGRPLIEFQSFTVEVRNDLRMFLLDVHCFSRDNDLGVHILFPEQQENWSFRGNIFETTRFTCKLEWEVGFLEFDVFYSDRDLILNYCGNSTCIWSAKQDGIYLADNNGHFVFRDYWDMLRK